MENYKYCVFRFFDIRFMFLYTNIKFPFGLSVEDSQLTYFVNVLAFF